MEIKEQLPIENPEKSELKHKQWSRTEWLRTIPREDGKCAFCICCEVMYPFFVDFEIMHQSFATETILERIRVMMEYIE